MNFSFTSLFDSRNSSVRFKSLDSTLQVTSYAKERNAEKERTKMESTSGGSVCPAPLFALSSN